VKSLVLAVALVALTAGCAKKPKPAKEKPVAGLTDVEVKRGEEACKTYVDKVCACAQTKPDLAQQCELAKSLPHAMELTLGVATQPDQKPDIAKQAYDSTRQQIAVCIQETAKLPSLGCN
jgi:hypothetical protein